MAIGRISGPLLKDNLLRDEVNLAFETNLLYLDVNTHADDVSTNPGDPNSWTGRIGIRNTNPAYPLDVTGTFRATTILGGELDIDEVLINNNSISSQIGDLVLSAATASDKVTINSNVLVNGNLHATGSITADGSLTFGDQDTDNVVFAADINSDFLPNVTDTFKLGTPSKRWDQLNVHNINVGDLQIQDNVIEPINTNGNLVLRANGTGQVTISSSVGLTGNLTLSGDLAVNGGDLTSTSATFNLLNQPTTINFGSSATAIEIGSAVGTTSINNAVSIDGSTTMYGVLSLQNTANISGNLTVSGIVDVTGDIFGDALQTDNIRITGNNISTTLSNSDLELNTVGSGTILANGRDLLNYDATTWYVSEDSGSDSNDGRRPYSAFATLKYALTQVSSGDTVLLAPGTYTEVFPITVPQGVTVKGSGLRATKIKPTVGTNNKDCFLLNGETTIEDMTIADMFYDSINNTGYAFRFAPSTSVTTRSPYVQRITVLNKGSGAGGIDPYGFTSADAGRGAYLDGSQVSWSSLEAAILFNECTFIVPNSRALIMTNGARTEWLNCFTYFADLAIEGVVGVTGRGGDGKTYISLSGVTGTFNVGNTLSFYADDGTTVLASGTIEAIKNSSYQLDGSVSGFLLNTDRDNKPITVNGNAQLSVAQIKFGSASLVLDGTGDYLSLASDNDFGWGTGDFTIEGWFYKNSASQMVLFDQRTSGTSQLSVYVESNAAGNLRLFVNGSYVLTSSNAMTTGAWNHVAISRASGTTRFFINGTVSTNTYADTNNYGSAKPLVIGATWSGATAFNGYIDEVRVSKGIARYTTTFTPATSEFSGDSSTVLLLHFNGSSGSTNIVDDGITIQDVRSSSGGTATGITRYDRAEFAAELRSISGANVYGNQGVKADGVDVVLQLMAHNFAYIGTGADLTNNKATVVQANEVIEVNSGRVYYNSVDQSGDYRIGDYFTVDFETGSVSFSGATFDVTSLTGITFTDGSNTTIVNPSQVSTGNLVLAGNTLSSTTGGITIDPSGSETLNLNANTTVSGNLDVGGNVIIGGTITVGNADTDSITIVADFTSNLLPNESNTYDLGSPSKEWRTLYAGQFTNGNIVIDDNYIRTTVSNSNLELQASGTGNIELQSDTNVTGNFNVSNDATIQNNLTVQGNTVVQGDTTQQGNVAITGTLTVTGDIVGGPLRTDDIQIVGNKLETTQSNSNLELNTVGTGSIELQTNTNVTGTFDVSGQSTLASVNVEDLTSGRVVLAGASGELEDSANLTFNGSLLTVTGDITVTGNTILGDANSDTIDVRAEFISNLIPDITDTYDLGTSTKRWDQLFTKSANIGDVAISGTTIESTQVNSDLYLNANGTGSVIISNLLTLGGGGSLSFSGDTVNFNNILIDGDGDYSVIRTLDSNTNLYIDAAGTGTINLTSNTNIVGNLDVTGDITLGGNIRIGDQEIDTVTVQADFTSDLIPNASNLYDLGTAAKQWRVVNAAEFDNGTININDNVITTTVSNANLELRANGTGKILVPNNTFEVTNALTVNGTSTLNAVNVTTTLDVNGQTTLASVNVEDLTSGRVVLAGTSGELEDSANLTFNGSLLTVTGNQTVTGTVTASTSVVTPVGNITVLNAGEANIDGIRIDTNVISTVNSNANLELNPSGSGIVYIQGTGAVRIPAGNTAERPPTGESGFIRYNYQTNNIEAWNGVVFAGISGGGSSSDANGDTRITFETSGNNEDIIRFFAGLAGPTLGSTVGANEIMQVSNDGVIINGTIKIQNNVIENINSNEDLIIRASGTGRVILDGSGEPGATGNVFATDPLLSLNTAQTGANSYDSGLIIERGTDINAGFIWDESADEFAAISTIEQGTVRGNVAITGYQNVSVASVKLNSENINKITFTDASKIVRSLDTGRSADVGGLMKFTAGSELAIPAGTTSQRPATPQNASVRYNSDLDYFEGYANNTWQGLGVGFGSAPTYQGFVANGTNFEFTLNTAPLSAAGIIVTINGVVQEPEYAYEVEDNILRFIDESSTVITPDLGDRIDVRFLSKPAISSVRERSFMGDGSTTTFGMSLPIASKPEVLIFVNNIYQDVEVYSVSGKNVIFSQAPQSDDRINIVHIAGIVAPNVATIQEADDAAIAFAIALG